MVPQPYAAGGNQSYLGVLGHNQWLAVLEVDYPDRIYMTSGSRLEMVGSLRLVGGFHGVQTYSRVFLGDEVDNAREGSEGRCLVGPALHHH
jgi:hypothetical protein